MSISKSNLYARAAIAAIAASLWVGNSLTSAQSDAPELEPDHPTRYTVQPGDTLWDIADKFLEKPWRWPEVWQANPEIENPHLIFPGDVLILSNLGGKPQVRALTQLKLTKLSPAIYARKREDAIPTIPPNIIQPFLSAPLIIEPGELDDTGYVAIGEEGAIALGKYDVAYARGLEQPTVASGKGSFFQIFRPERALVHPETEEPLGIQTLHVGDARMLETGETAKVEIVRAFQSVSPGDRLLPVARDIELPYFQPRSPERALKGLIIAAPGRVADFSRLDTVIITLGARDQIEPGHVLRILRQEPAQKDPVTGKLFIPPPQPSGLLMVFRVFEKVSYALVMASKRPLSLNDLVETP